MTPPGVPRIVDLDYLEGTYQRAFAHGRASGLDVIGYGEITSVVAWPTPDGPAAVKRLPDFPSLEALGAYREVFDEYLVRLRSRGVPVLATELLELPGRPIAYAVQPAVPADRKVERILRRAGPVQAEDVIRRILEHTTSSLEDPLLGFDAQLSNWMLDGQDLSYVDITTPFVRDAATGMPRLDTRLFVGSLPWVLRSPVQRWVAPSIIAGYFDLRVVLLDVLANMIKEEVEEWLPLATALVNGLLADAISNDEIRRYYSSDARTWAVLQRLRKADRLWRVKVRRHPYPVLLPGDIKR